MGVASCLQRRGWQENWDACGPKLGNWGLTPLHYKQVRKKYTANFTFQTQTVPHRQISIKYGICNHLANIVNCENFVAQLAVLAGQKLSMCVRVCAIFLKRFHGKFPMNIPPDNCTQISPEIPQVEKLTPDNPPP